MFEAVIVDAIRTPIGKRKGFLKDVHPADLLGDLLAQLIDRNHIDPTAVDDVIAGCVDQGGEQAANVARNAWLSAGLPESVPATTVDRQCGSSLQALHFAAQGIMAGAYDLVIAAGVESMTRVPMLSTINGTTGSPMSARIKQRYQINGIFNQAVGAEMIAKKWDISREELDRYSLQSHTRAIQAISEGRFTNEIVPVYVQNEQGNRILFQQDEGPRSDTSYEKISSLPAAFDGLQWITAGNASQISDGASAVLVASMDTARKLGLRPRARFVSFSVVGVDPVTMLTGPIPATKKVLQRAGLTVNDIDLFEVNEAFASVVLAWQKEIQAPWEKINVNGGAIALGHPLGATGTRLAATLLNELERRNERYGLMAICEGGGMANATIIERLS